LLKGNNNTLRAKKTIFESRYGSMDSKFLFLYELGTCPQNLIHTRRMKP
jgi:hypothetical protein